MYAGDSTIVAEAAESSKRACETCIWVSKKVSHIYPYVLAGISRDFALLRRWLGVPRDVIVSVAVGRVVVVSSSCYSAKIFSNGISI